MSHRESEQKIVVGGGCFWCIEEMFRYLRGVTKVTSGYAGGQEENPTYEQVCTGRTGHAEVVEVVFDPEVISLTEILDAFFVMHDPTTPDRQGNDVGPQYRSIILYDSPEQKATAESVIQRITEEKVWDAPIVTELKPLNTFYPAEEEHHLYFERNPFQPYCRLVIAPKVTEFKRRFSDKLVTHS